MDMQELLEEIILYALDVGDQDLWDILYPFLKRSGFICDKSVIKTVKLIEEQDENFSF